MKSQRILFTGSAGFCGSAVCERLVQEGHTVIGFDNYSRVSHLNTEQNFETFNGDVRNGDDFRKVVQKYNGFDALWHFAYINGTSTFYSQPDLVLDVGVKGALNTLDFAIEACIPNYILCSSSEVYNQPEHIPTPEIERILIPDVYNPRFSYSGGKIISELLAIHYGAQIGLNVKIFRPHNIYGPNMGTEHFIPQIIKKILKPEKANYQDRRLIVPIQGNGQETRSFCYIDDAVDEMILAANDSLNQTYNIGVENEVKIGYLSYMIADFLDIKIRVEPSEKSPEGATNRRCPDMKKIFDMGYKPKHTLNDGLQKTVSWYKKFYEEQK